MKKCFFYNASKMISRTILFPTVFAFAFAESWEAMEVPVQPERMVSGLLFQRGRTVSDGESMKERVTANFKPFSAQISVSIFLTTQFMDSFMDTKLQCDSLIKVKQKTVYILINPY
ncbi:MAG: hypothetical protein LBG04_01470 [Holosporaceae bacterium]|nr:hypothetical protein [Holosporaceae bacterium]